MEHTESAESPVRFLVTVVGGEDIDETDLDAMTRSLQSELEDLPEVTQVGPSREATGVPQGAKSPEVFALGALAMAVLPKAVPALIDFFKEWALRPGYRPVKIKLLNSEIEYDPRIMSVAEVKQLMAELKATMEDPKAGY